MKFFFSSKQHNAEKIQKRLRLSVYTHFKTQCVLNYVTLYEKKLQKLHVKIMAIEMKQI